MRQLEIIIELAFVDRYFNRRLGDAKHTPQYISRGLVAAIDRMAAQPVAANFDADHQFIVW